MFLKHSGPMPFTGSAICTELGIPETFADLVDGLIATEATRSTKPVTESVWAMYETNYARSAYTGGRVPASIGEPYEMTLGNRGQYRELVRDVTYLPDPEAVAKLHDRIIARVHGQNDKALQLALSGALQP